MPGVHRPDKEPLGINASRKLVYRVKKAAFRLNVDMTALVISVLEDRFGKVHLNKEDMERIDEATRLSEKTRRRIATRFLFLDEE